MTSWLSYHWLKIVAVLMIVGIFPAMKYSAPLFYFELLNWVVMGAGIILALQASERDHGVIMWAAILIAVLFNPFAIFSIRTDIWQIIDIVVGIFFISSFFLVKPGTQK